MDLKDAVERHFRDLRKLPNVLNVAPGWKVTGGRIAGPKAVVVYVKEKVSESKLKPEEVVPKQLEGFPTDVIELRPADYEVGDTSVSRRSPEAQRRMASGVIK